MVRSYLAHVASPRSASSSHIIGNGGTENCLEPRPKKAVIGALGAHREIWSYSVLVGLPVH